MTNLKELKPEPELKKLEKKLRNRVGKAIAEYNMIEESDVVMAALSGGKLCVI
jgi:tRNA 2-thiocytidine biosynthesis protein TtcA